MWFSGGLVCFGVLSSMNQYSKVLVIWFLMLFVLIRNFLMSFEVV